MHRPKIRTEINKGKNSRGKSYLFHCRKQVQWSEEQPDLEEEQHRKLLANVETDKENTFKDDKIIGVIFLKPSEDQ